MSLNYLYTAVSWVLLRWHQLFTAVGLPSDGGLNWALSIVFLVVTARVLLFRFFIKQVHYQRKMQLMQPKIKKLQEKHKGDKATLQREMMALQQAEGFNPISGCLPMFLQLPIFISLFHVLKHMSAAVSPGYPEHKKTLYGFTTTQTYQAAHAKLFGAPLAASLRESSTKVHHVLGGNITSTRLVIIFLVIISAGATLITQRAVIANAPTPAEGQAATIQRLMLFGIPASVVISGLFFPLGVLLYWFSSNLWTMGQQFYILRYHPHDAPASAPLAAESTVTKSLAPRPGQRPTAKGARGRTTDPAAVAPVDPHVEAGASPAPAVAKGPAASNGRPGKSVSLDKADVGATPSRRRRSTSPPGADSAPGAAEKAVTSGSDSEVRASKPVTRTPSRSGASTTRRPSKKRR